MSTGTVSGERAATLRRRIRWIVSATIAYNVVEAIVAITAGTIASSGALIAFGLALIVLARGSSPTSRSTRCWSRQAG